MKTYPAPRRVEWTGPDGWTVWADEDGVHVRSRSGDALEQPEVKRLLDLWMATRDAVSTESVPAPRPPTPGEMREMSHARAERYAERRATRAIAAEFNTSDAPF